MPSFEECLQIILHEKIPSAEDRQIYNNHSEKIRNYLMEHMKKINEEFKYAFDGLSLTGSYLDKLKIDLPDEFDMDLKLKMPFDMTPIADPQLPGFVILKANNCSHRFVGQDGKMCRRALQIWLQELFLQTIGNGILLKVDYRTYLITYPEHERGNGVAHTVKAREIRSNGSAGYEISFDFVPAFEFHSSQWPFEKNRYSGEDSWFAIPYGKDELKSKYTFKVSAPHCERAALHDKQNLKNSLRLMKAFRDANDLEKLYSYTLKTVYLEELDKRTSDFWQKPIGEILIAMLKCLLLALEKDSLPFFLHEDCNQLNLLPKQQAIRSKYETVIKETIWKLEMHRGSNNVIFNNIRAIFVR